jgi:hypothetical protein
MHNDTVNENPADQQPAAEKELTAKLKIKDSVKVGDSLLLNFTVYNFTDSTKKLLQMADPVLSPYSANTWISKMIRVKKFPTKALWLKG